MHCSVKRDGRSAIRGYTLIELAVVMTVTGILVASFTSAYNLYMQQQMRMKTEQNASMVTSSLSNFLIQKGRYPCPARADAHRDEADYGMETECNPVMNCDDVAKTCVDNPAYPTYNYNTCPVGNAYPAAPDIANGQGLCFEKSEAYITLDNWMWLKGAGGVGCFNGGNGNAGKSKGFCPGASGVGIPTDKITIQPPVRRGIIPFRTLALPEEMAFDGQGNRFSYAVSENQAVTAAYEPNKGGIRVLNAQGQPYFAITVDTPVLRPNSLAGSAQFGTTTYTYVNEATANPAAGSTTLPGATNYLNSNLNQATAYLEFNMSDPSTSVSPGGSATLSFIAAQTKSGPALNSGGNIGPQVEIKEAGVSKIGPSNGTGACGTTAWAKFGSTWTQYDCVFDGSLITDWNSVTVKFTADNAQANRGWALGWVQLTLPTPLVGFTDYFLSSAGKDRAGAYTRAGVKAVPCATTTSDALNCSTKTLAQYRMTEYNEAYVTDATRCNTANCHFDDYVKFFSSTETPLWRVSGTGAHIRDLLNVETAGGKIAIAQTPDPLVSAVLQVGGQVRADTSNALMTNACDFGHSNCFNVGSLADPVAQAANFTCPAGQYATGFELGKLKCSTTQIIKCATGEISQGVNPDGTLKCTGAVTCPSTTVNTCFFSATGIQATTVLPAGVENQIYNTPSSGFNYTQAWQCGPSPWWTMQSDTGVCDCAPVDETYDVPCNSRWSGNWTGNITVHHTHDCPSGADNGGVEVGNTCVCTDTTESYTDFAGCGSGFSGGVTYTRTWDCASGTAGAWSTAVATGNTCTCTPQADETRDLCPGFPWAGSTPEIRSYTCPAGTWSAWAPNGPNTCACTAATQNQDLGCAYGQSGNHPQQRVYDCPSNLWGPWTDVATATPCTCAPATESDTSTDCGQTGWSGTITRHHDFQCPSETWTSWVVDSNTCSCTGTSAYRQISCTAPLAGTRDQQRNWDCPSNSWGAWFDTSVNCYANTFNWTPKVAYDGPYGTALPTHAGDTCTLLGDTTTCSAQAPSGSGFYHYATCRCE